MAKTQKIATVATETVATETVPAVIPAATQVAVNLQVDNTLLLKVAVSEFEEASIKKSEDLVKERRTASEAVSKATQAVSEALKAQAEQELSKRASDLEAALKAFSADPVKVKTEFGGALSEGNAILTVRVTVSLEGSRGGAFETAVKLAPNAKTAEALAVKKQADGHLDALESQYRAVREGLNNIARMQRRAEAAMAARAVGAQDGGKQLLEAVRASVFTPEVQKLLGA